MSASGPTSRQRRSALVTAACQAVSQQPALSSGYSALNFGLSMARRCSPTNEPRDNQAEVLRLSFRLFPVSDSGHERSLGETTGARYVGNMRAMSALHLDPSGAERSTFTFHGHVLGLGQAPDFRQHTTLLPAVDANGNVTTEILKVRVSSR
jgi:hypothetical protein